MINENFVFLAVLLSLLGISGYAYDTLRGKTQPNRVTWFLWALAPLIAFFAEVSEGVGIQSLLIFMVGFGNLVVFTFSFINPKAFWKITKLDIICGILSVLAILLWFVTKNGLIAIFFSILADLLATIPTIRKSIKEPDSESYNVYFFASIGAVITLFTISDWTFANCAFPLYIFMVCTLLFLLIFRKQGLKLIKS